MLNLRGMLKAPPPQPDGLDGMTKLQLVAHARALALENKALLADMKRLGAMRLGMIADNIVTKALASTITDKE